MTLDIISDLYPKAPPIEYLNEVNSTVFRLNGKVLLRNNRNLSEDEFMVAREVCNQVNSFVAERDSYVQENRLSPLFCYGDANWSKEPRMTILKLSERLLSAGMR